MALSNFDFLQLMVHAHWFFGASLICDLLVKTALSFRCVPISLKYYWVRAFFDAYQSDTDFSGYVPHNFPLIFEISLFSVVLINWNFLVVHFLYVLTLLLSFRAAWLVCVQLNSSQSDGFCFFDRFYVTGTTAESLNIWCTDEFVPCEISISPPLQFINHST